MATIKQTDNSSKNNGLAGQNRSNQPEKSALNKEQAEKELAAIALRIEEIARQIQSNPQLPANDVQMVSWLKEFEHLITVSNVIAKNTPNIGIEFVHSVAFAIQTAKEAQTATQLAYAHQAGNEEPAKIPPGIEALLTIDITKKKEEKEEKTDKEKVAIVDIIKDAILGAQSDKLKPERQRIRHTAITNVLTEYMTGDKSNTALQEKKSNIMDSFLGEEIRAQEQQQIEQEAKAKSAENFLKYMATRKNMPASIIIGDVINRSKELAKHREKVREKVKESPQKEMESGGALSSLFGDDDNQNSKTQGQSNDAGADKNVTTKDPERKKEEPGKEVEVLQDDKKEQEKQATLSPEIKEKLPEAVLKEIERIKESANGVAKEARENEGKSLEGPIVGANLLEKANEAVNGPAAPKQKSPEVER